MYLNLQNVVQSLVHVLVPICRVDGKLVLDSNPWAGVN